MELLELPDELMCIICQLSLRSMVLVPNKQIRELCRSVSTNLVLFRTSSTAIISRQSLQTLDVPILSPALWGSISSLSHLETIKCSVCNFTSLSGDLVEILTLLHLEIRSLGLASEVLYNLCPNLLTLIAPDSPLPSQLVRLRSFTIGESLNPSGSPSSTNSAVQLPIEQFLASRLQYPCFTAVTLLRLGPESFVRMRPMLKSLNEQLVLCVLPRMFRRSGIPGHTLITGTEQFQQFVQRWPLCQHVQLERLENVTIFSGLALSLKALTSLTLSVTSLDRELWEGICCLSRLQSLNLEVHVQPTNLSMENLVLSTLQRFGIMYSTIFPSPPRKDWVVASFPSLPALTHLQSDRWVNVDPQRDDWPNLQELVLDRITPEQLADLAVLTSLTSLKFSPLCPRTLNLNVFCHVQPWVDQLIKFPRLRLLDWGRAVMRSAPLRELLQRLPLRSLKISMSLMSFECLQVLRMYGEHLIELRILKTAGFTDAEDAIDMMIDSLAQHSLAFCRVDAVMKEKKFAKCAILPNGAFVSVDKCRLTSAKMQIGVLDDNSVEDV